jgi:hypothetical protein
MRQHRVSSLDHNARQPALAMDVVVARRPRNREGYRDGTCGFMTSVGRMHSPYAYRTSERRPDTAADLRV